MRKLAIVAVVIVAPLILLVGAYIGISKVTDRDYIACMRMAAGGLLKVAPTRDVRFLGKVTENTAQCRGDERAVAQRDTPWVDWANYWATGDASSKSGQLLEGIGPLRHLLKDGYGVDGALMDLEYERIELIKFNLFDNSTYKDYVTGRDGLPGPVIRTWPEMRLPPDHAQYARVGGASEQLCRNELIRHRTLTGICNDLKNPAMGSTGMLFARNVEFEQTFPDEGHTDFTKNRHGDRISLETPDPQVISRKLFTREQRSPEKCNEGKGLPGNSVEAQCDYKQAPFFNVLAAFWIQFMTHDWFSHLVEARNDRAQLIDMGCKNQKVNGKEKPLTADQAQALGCRPGDRMERSLYATEEAAPSFRHGDREQLARAHRTTRNHVTAWWDASQIYGYDTRSQRRVKRDPEKPAKLLMVPVGKRDGAGERYGYLPRFETCARNQANCTPDPINPEWARQEAVAFPDNWTIGLSFLHNVFVREHNIFVEEFRKYAAENKDADSGLRDPANPERVIAYQDVSDEELFQITRLVVAAEIAKIHTIEWTSQLLYDEPLYLAMNSNWFGLVRNSPLIEKALSRVVQRLGESEEAKKATTLYSVFASGPGIIGTGSMRKDWTLTNPEHVNGGVNHFGSPFNFPEEFVTVYRLHPLVPDLIELRELDRDPNVIRAKVPVVNTFRAAATNAMREHGLANWAVSMGRQRLGLLLLQNSPLFLQNLDLGARLNTPTHKLDVLALDIVRDRERGVPRFNEFRRQYGLRQLTSFDDFIDRRVSPAQQTEQAKVVERLREVYGTHRCDASKVITASQRNKDGTPINDCLGHPDGSVVDNVEDIDTVVGWLAENPRPHGFAISETQFQVFILNASRRLFSDRFFTSSFRPEFYSHFGLAWAKNNGAGEKMWEQGEPNGHRQEISPMKRVLLRSMPELREELSSVINVFDPWARDRGEYYSLKWTPRPGAESDPAFAEKP